MVLLKNKSVTITFFIICIFSIKYYVSLFMETLGNNLEIKTSNSTNTNYYCVDCDYSCIRKFNWDRHIMTSKHKKKTKRVINEQNEQIKSNKIKCEKCNKIYQTNAGLWKHKKLCNVNNKTSDKELIMLLIKQNAKLFEQNSEMLEIIKNGTHNTTTTNSNNNNKTFNLQFFLNETCKDAMNISEFVSSIKVNLEELEHTGRQCYIEGISNIILKRLKNLEQHFRPLHCSDTKREAFYVKENNEWKKENDDKPILTKAIKTIANENIKQIRCWRDKYPDCTESDSKNNDLYLKIVSNSMNGSTVEEGCKNIDKIISNVAKEVIIDKNNSL